MTLQAFHNDPQLKADLLVEVEKHRLADAIISGTYGEERNGHFVGCAVGCSIESLNRLRGQKFMPSSHSAYPELVGVPEWLAHLQDRLHESMPEERQPFWPGQFWTAIPVGADLETVKAPFLIFVLESALTTFDHAKFPDVATAINRVIGLYRNGGSPSDFSDAADAAARAADRCCNSDQSGDAAAHAAAWAAWPLYVAARAAVNTVAWPPYVAARAATYSKFADKLLELMAAA